MALSPARAAQLKAVLDPFSEPKAWRQRVAQDPVEFPHRYQGARDVEVVGLLSTCLAYGRADLFKPKIDGVLKGLGSSPARAVEAMTVAEAGRLLKGFVYRFNLAGDLAVLLLGMGAVLRTHGSLEGLFVEGLSRHGGSVRRALAHFARGVREAAPAKEIRAQVGQVRALHHLLPQGDGAAKRLNLYLRWMVRGPDAIDFGVWRRVKPAQLLIPLDTHVARIAGLLGLTTYKSVGWAMAQDITASLAQLDAEDPVRYDFALCHYGMSGVCPSTPVPANCQRCALRAHCRVGKRMLRGTRA